MLPVGGLVGVARRSVHVEAKGHVGQRGHRREAGWQVSGALGVCGSKLYVSVVVEGL